MTEFDILHIILFTLSLLTAAIAWLIARYVYGIKLKAKDAEKYEIQKRLNEKEVEFGTISTELHSTKLELDQTKESAIKLDAELVARNRTEKSEAQKLEQIQKDFEVLANKIFEKKSEVFESKNKQNLGAILKPLGEQIERFERRVDISDKDRNEKTTRLEEQIKLLQDLNNENVSVTRGLTKALKGDTKTQGNWGELILTKVLELSGLENGKEYQTQESSMNHDGKRVQPDVVISMPEGKKMIVDSKVSLTAYERYINESDENKREQFKKEHLSSIKTHIKGLSEKNYHSIYPEASPEFVLMFIPIETAFSLALEQEHDLFNFAFTRNIVVVTPSTLLATLKTVEGLWKSEKQRKNALEIATEAGRMHDKFVGFLKDMQDLGNRLAQGRRSYDAAISKLNEGPGNLVKKASNLKAMGAKVNKQIEEKWLSEKAETEKTESEDTKEED